MNYEQDKDGVACRRLGQFAKAIRPWLINPEKPGKSKTITGAEVIAYLDSLPGGDIHLATPKIPQLIAALLSHINTKRKLMDIAKPLKELLDADADAIGARGSETFVPNFGALVNLSLADPTVLVEENLSIGQKLADLLPLTAEEQNIIKQENAMLRKALASDKITTALAGVNAWGEKITTRLFPIAVFMLAIDLTAKDNMKKFLDVVQSKSLYKDLAGVKNMKLIPPFLARSHAGIKEVWAKIEAQLDLEEKKAKDLRRAAKDRLPNALKNFAASLEQLTPKPV